MNEAMAKALGRIPSGCAIVTARTETARTGMLASWVQQAAFEPPMVCVAIKRGRPIGSLIDASGHFVLNLLGADPKAMFKHFGKGFGPGKNAFAGLAAENVVGGVAIPDRVGRLSVRVISKADAGDHDVYIGEVIEAEASDGEPYVHLRKSGANY